jgi:hypothetical protein
MPCRPRPSRITGATWRERGIALTEVCPPEIRFIGHISNEGTVQMIVIGVDAHTRSHALDAATGAVRGQLTIPASDDGHSTR